jgi:hypothetical protein
MEKESRQEPSWRAKGEYGPMEATPCGTNENWNSRSFRMDTREKVADFEERGQGGKGCGSASYNR